jgi:hypothetical protein
MQGEITSIDTLTFVPNHVYALGNFPRLLAVPYIAPVVTQLVLATACFVAAGAHRW